MTGQTFAILAEGLFLLHSGLAARASDPLFIPPQGATATFTVDCGSRGDGPQLAKNIFGVYQTPFWFRAHSPATHDLAPLLREAGVHDLRYELAWGKPDVFAPDQVSGTEGAMRCDFSPIDPFLSQLARANVSPLFVLGYNPRPLQARSGDWQSWKEPPRNLHDWQQACRAFCAHVDAIPGLRGVAYEVWNEPDLPGDGAKVFFNGDAAAYGALYQAAATAVRSATKDRAKVGGPAVAYDITYLTQSGMLAGPPIDFVSIHAYANFSSQLAHVRAALVGTNLPIYLTEYASYKAFTPTGANAKHAAAAAFFDDVQALLSQPRLSKVYWAQWIDDASGMLTEDLHRRALFNAYCIYQTMLPPNRVSILPTSDQGISAMAATDEQSAGIVLWSNGDADRTSSLTLHNMPTSEGVLRVFRIDAHHASFGDDPQTEKLQATERSHFSHGTAYWQGSIPARSVVYLSATGS